MTHRKGTYHLKVEECGLQQYFSADDREKRGHEVD